MAELREQTLSSLASLAPEIFRDEGERDLDDEFIPVLRTLLTNDEVELPQENVHSTRCNKSLDVQEVAYCCRECETDPTCVLCAKCFDHSIHKTHRYRMITSAGGCCDCGDPEAWTDGVHCTLHEPKESTAMEEDEDPLSNMSQVLITRAPVVFTTLLKYCQRVLYWVSEDEELPASLNQSNTAKLLTEDSYHTLLYNDEIHSYDDVIYTLTENLGLGPVEAIELTTAVDQMGRSLVHSGTKEECEEYKRKVNVNLHRPLQVMAIHSAVVAHQNCALYLLEYLEKLASQSAGLCRLLSEALLSPTEGGHSILDAYFLKDSDTWKGSASRWQSFILQSIFIDLKKKEDLGISLTKNYNFLLRNFRKDLHIRDVSATSLSVQLFTTPSLTRVLIIEHDLLSVLFGTVKDLFSSSVDEKGRLVIKGNSDLTLRILYCVHDLRYVLRTQPPGESEWTPDFRAKFIDGFKVFLSLLSMMEDLDVVQRQRGRHVSREVEWEPALNMWCMLQPVVLMMMQWCHSDVIALQKAVKATRDACLYCDSIKFINTDPPLIKHFIGEDPISIHCPVPRLLAGLLTAANRHGLQLQELLELSDGKPHSVKKLLMMMEKPLRCLVFSGQVHAGMWKKNGYSVLNQVFNYQFFFCQTGMYDKDLIMIKSAAALLEPHVFLHTLLHKYRLQKWFEGSENPMDGRDEPADDAICYLTAEAEELVYLLIIVLGEHYFPGVGQVTEADCLRRELIHTLYMSPLSHNDVIKRHKNYAEKEIVPILKDIAEFERGSQGRKGMYKLKPEFEKEQTLFFYHYTRVDQSKAEEMQRKKVKAAGGPAKLGAVPPPTPPLLCEPFKGILNLIHSRILWKILLRVFQRVVSSSSKLWSDKLLHESLYLCGLMLLEEDASGRHEFSENSIEPGDSEKVSLLEILEKLLSSQKAEEHRPLLTWIIQKLHSVQQAQIGTPVDAEDCIDGGKRKVQEFKVPSTSSKNPRSELAAEKRKKIMEQMAKQQKNFLKKHKNELENIVSSPTDDSPRLSASMSTEGGPLCSVGVDALKYPPVNPPPFTCNICQGEGLEDQANDSGVPILGAWIQRSSVMRQTIPENTEDEEPNFLACTLSRSLGIYANSCSHTMHYDCWKKYQDSKVGQEKNRIFFVMSQTVEWLKGEFLCPLCQFHCNAVLPLLPVKRDRDPQSMMTEMPFNEWLEALVGLIRSYLPLTGEEVVEMDSSVRKEEGVVSDKVPGPGCEGVGKQKLTELFPKYLKLNTADRSTSVEGTGTSEFAQVTFTNGYNTDPNESDERVPVAMWNTCAYTMSCFERANTIKGKSLLLSLSDRDLQHFEALVRTVTIYSSEVKPSVLAKHCQYLLNILMLMELPSVSRDVAEKVDNQLTVPDFLSVDPFMLLVNFHFAVSALFNVLSEKESVKCDSLVAIADKFIVQLTLCIKIVQFLSTVSPATYDDPSARPSEDDLAVATMWKKWRKLLQLPVDCQASTVDTLYEGLSDYLQPFLQSAALFYHCVTGILLPEEGSNLYTYLAVPSNPCELLGPDSSYWELVNKWCHHKGVTGVVKEDKDLLSLVPKTQPLYLMSLPDQYNDVIKLSAEFSCGKLASAPRENTHVMLCLLCGQRLCSSSYCCQYTVNGQQLGAFSNHARSCGAGYGMGLWIMECQVVLINVTDVEIVRGCFLSAPYLDEYGEPDVGFKNGRPLTLNKESQQELCDLWLSHEFAGRITKELDRRKQLLSFPWYRL